MKRWRGLKALVHDAVDLTTTIVGETHEQVAKKAMAVLETIEPIAGPARVVNDLRRETTEGVLSAVKLVNRTVEQLTDAGLDQVDDTATTNDGETIENAVPMRSDVTRDPQWLGDAALGAVNGIVGDYLHARTNSLALEMKLRFRDQYLSDRPVVRRTQLADVHDRLALFVHGLSTTEWCWVLNAAEYHNDPSTTFGTLLDRDLGFSPIYARYNSGRHVSENGKLLADEIERLIDALPRPPRELLLVGHSMGGLVVRSACHYAKIENHRWLQFVQRVICLGSPHQGAALEKLGNVATAILTAIDVPGTTIPAKIINARSAGIKDLRYGYIVDEEWLDRDPDALLDDNRRQVPLLENVAYYFLSATLTRDQDHPLGSLVGDLLVRVPSASGPKSEESKFGIETACFGGVMHHELQNHPDVYAMILKILSRDVSPKGEGETQAP